MAGQAMHKFVISSQAIKEQFIHEEKQQLIYFQYSNKIIVFMAPNAFKPANKISIYKLHKNIFLKAWASLEIIQVFCKCGTQ